MMDKREVVNQFSVLQGYIDEQNEGLTVKQLNLLKIKAQEVWVILENGRRVR
jgi:hypothetical protein